MGSMNNTTYLYHDRPLFGLDIGFSSLKAMQIESVGRKQKITGYGVTAFEAGAIEDGLIKDPVALAQSAKELFEKHLIGEITTRRVAVAIPASKTFNRLMSLPKLKESELDEAVKLEAEQYIPMPVDELYMDYTVLKRDSKSTELLAVAAPKKIVESYLQFTRLIGVESVMFETTIASAGRLFEHSERSKIPTVLIDLGSLSSDITIYDDGIVVTGTVPGGGDSFSSLIADKLKVSKQEAHIIKTKYGLGLSKKQKEITEGLAPVLDELISEVRRMIRYYEERSGSEEKIAQVVTMGGGANMPGLSEYMTNLLRLPVRMCDPWQHLDFGKLQPPNSAEKSMYVTVAGLALTNSKEIFV